MTYEELMQLQGDESSLQNEIMSSRAYKDRATALYNELDQLNQQYGQASILPDRVVDRIHSLHTELSHTMNEWEQHKGRARGETRLAEGAKQTQMGLGAIGQQLRNPGASRAMGDQNMPIQDRLNQLGSGQQSNLPAAKRSFSNVPPPVPKNTHSGMPSNPPKPVPAPSRGDMEMEPQDNSSMLMGRRLGLNVPRYKAMMFQ